MISRLGLASDNGPGESTRTSCIDDIGALAFVEGTMSADRRTAAIEHIETCEACRELVASVVEMAHVQDTLLANADTAPGGPPPSFGGYSLGPLIAQGGMGRIYRARDAKLGRDVALKVPRSGNVAIARRFEREAAITARLEHPGIVPMHGAGTSDDGTPFYVMRYIDGRSLDALIEEAATPAARLALVDRVLDVARTMAYAHSKGIVHRDLKPNNVLVDAFGKTLIIDWGLAKQLADGRESLPSLGETEAPTRPSAYIKTRAGDVMGTPAFMPPEQAAGEPVDARADVYALGAVLKNVLTGRVPRESDPTTEGPPAIVDVCKRAMAWDAEERHADADAFASALEAALAATRVSPVSRRSRWLIFAAAGSALVAIGIVVAVVLVRRAALEGSMRPRVIARLPPDTGYLAISPDGKRVAYAGRERAYIEDLETGKKWSRNAWTIWPWIVVFESNDVVVYAVNDQLHGEAMGRVRWSLATDTIENAAKPERLSVEGYWLGQFGTGDVYLPTDDSRHLVLRDTTGMHELPSDSVRQLRTWAIAPGHQRLAFVELALAGTRIRVIDPAGQGITSPRVEDISAMTWLDDDTLMYVVGSTDGSTLYQARATPAGLAKPTLLYRSAKGGWLGSLAARGNRIVAGWYTSTYETRLHVRESRTERPLDKMAASAALGWIDETTFLAAGADGRIERQSIDARVLPQGTSVRLSGEPANATLAGNILVVALRGQNGRSIAAFDLDSPTPLWTTPVGTLTFVRCAGDRKRPCVAGKQKAGGLLDIVSIDPATGTLDDVVLASGVIADAAIDDAGTLLAWISDNRQTLVRELDGTAPPRELGPGHGGSHTISFAPGGGVLASVYHPEGRVIVAYREGTLGVDKVLNAGSALVSLLRPSPDGKVLTFRARTFIGDLVELRR